MDTRIAEKGTEMTIGVLALVALGVGAACFLPLLLKPMNKAVALVPVLATVVAANFMVRSWNWPELVFVTGVSAGLALASWMINRYTHRGHILFAHLGGGIIALDIVVCLCYGIGWAYAHLPTGVHYVATGAGVLLLVVLLGMRVHDSITDKQFERRIKKGLFVTFK